MKAIDIIGITEEELDAMEDLVTAELSEKEMAEALLLTKSVWQKLVNNKDGAD